MRPVRLQMVETAPLTEPSPTALAHADSFRYYPAYLVHRAAPDPQLWVVTGPGGRGMTLSPAPSEQTADRIGL